MLMPNVGAHAFAIPTRTSDAPSLMRIGGPSDRGARPLSAARGRNRRMIWTERLTYRSVAARLSVSPTCGRSQRRVIDLSLEGTVAIVTGASRGLGRTAAEALRDQGSSVVGAARRIDLLE